MPESMQAQSVITGIEIDPVTAQIAQALYPDADIRNEAFEKANTADGFYDLAISNIPFGDYKPFDPKLNKPGFLIHDYFFAAGLEKVRPGGLVMFITSRGTMDKMDNTLRQYVAERANLIGAIRLPNTAFKRNANTEVTTDILILKKLRLRETTKGGDLPSHYEHKWEHFAYLHCHEANVPCAKADLPRHFVNVQ
jgi:adenine-specific DNA methylase